MSFGRLSAMPAMTSMNPPIKTPAMNPVINLPAQNLAPKTTYTVGGQGYTPIPMPASVANNINLGWNYKTGQVIQPLTPQQQAQAYIPPMTFTPLVNPGSVFNNLVGGRVPTVAPVVPAGVKR